MLALSVKGQSIEAIARKLSLSREAISERLGKLEREARRQHDLHPPGPGTGYECVVSPLTWRGQTEPHALVAAVGIRRTTRRLLGWVVVKAGEEDAGRVQLAARFGDPKPPTLDPLTMEPVKPTAFDWLRKSLGAGWTMARNPEAIEQRLWLLMAWSHGWKLTGKRPEKKANA